MTREDPVGHPLAQPETTTMSGQIVGFDPAFCRKLLMKLKVLMKDEKHTNSRAIQLLIANLHGQVSFFPSRVGHQIPFPIDTARSREEFLDAVKILLDAAEDTLPNK